MSFSTDPQCFVVGLIPTAPFPDYPKVWQGVHRYVQEHRGEIRCLFLPKVADFPASLEGFRGHAILGSILEASEAEELERRGLKYMSLFRYGKVYPMISIDYAEVARTLAGLFVEKGFTRIQFLLDGNESNSLLVKRVLQEEAAHFGVTVTTFDVGPRTRAKGKWFLEDQLLDLADWLRPVEKPTAMLCTDPDHAHRILRVCDREGWNVPEDIALGVCWGLDVETEFSDPPLTACSMDSPEIGYQAISCLHRMLNDPEFQPPPVQLLSAFDLFERASSDQYAYPDPVVQKVLRCMEETLEDPEMSLDQVAKRAGVSRSTMDRRFFNVTGRRPGEQVRMFRAQRARELLLHTNRTLLDVSLECGIQDPAQFSRFVKSIYGVNPSDLRKHSRAKV